MPVDSLAPVDVATVAAPGPPPRVNSLEPMGRRPYADVVSQATGSGFSPEVLAEELGKHGYAADPKVLNTYKVDFARRKEAQRPGTWRDTFDIFASNFMPFSDVVGPGVGNEEYRTALDRANRGEATDDDIRSITRFEGNRQYMSGMESQGVPGKIVTAGGELAQIGGEMVVGGKIAKQFAPLGLSRTPLNVAFGGGRAATVASFAGRQAVVAAASPALYVPMAQQINEREGRRANDPRGYPTAVAHGYLTALVLGHLPKLGGGKGVARGALAAGTLGPVEMAALEQGVSVLDEYVVPAGSETGTNYGNLGRLYTAYKKGDLHGIDEEWGHLAATALTFAFMSGVHRGVDKLTAERPVLDAFDQGIKDGLRPVDMLRVTEDIGKRMDADPYYDRSAAREALEPLGRDNPALKRFVERLTEEAVPEKSWGKQHDEILPDVEAAEREALKGYEEAGGELGSQLGGRSRGPKPSPESNRALYLALVRRGVPVREAAERARYSPVGPGAATVAGAEPASVPPTATGVRGTRRPDVPPPSNLPPGGDLMGPGTRTGGPPPTSPDSPLVGSGVARPGAKKGPTPVELAAAEAEAAGKPSLGTTRTNAERVAKRAEFLRRNGFDDAGVRKKLEADLGPLTPELETAAGLARQPLPPSAGVPRPFDPLGAGRDMLRLSQEPGADAPDFPKKLRAAMEKEFGTITDKQFEAAETLAVEMQADLTGLRKGSLPPEQFVERAIDRDPGLTAGNKALFKKETAAFMATLSVDGRKRLAANISEVRYFNTTKEATLAGLEHAVRLAERAGQIDAVAEIRVEMASAQRGEFEYGGIVLGDGSVFLDGSWLDAPGKRTLAPGSVYAHEYGHVIDGTMGSFRELSTSPEWVRDVFPEVRTVSQYADNPNVLPGLRPVEAFAEFQRYLHTAPGSLANKAAAYPKAYQFLKERGLWPEKATGTGPAGKLDEVFDPKNSTTDETGSRDALLETGKPAEPARQPLPTDNRMSAEEFSKLTREQIDEMAARIPEYLRNSKEWNEIAAEGVASGHIGGFTGNDGKFDGAKLAFYAAEAKKRGYSIGTVTVSKKDGVVTATLVKDPVATVATPAEPPKRDQEALDRTKAEAGDALEEARAAVKKATEAVAPLAQKLKIAQDDLDKAMKSGLAPDRIANFREKVERREAARDAAMADMKIARDSLAAAEIKYGEAVEAARVPDEVAPDPEAAIREAALASELSDRDKFIIASRLAGSPLEEIGAKLNPPVTRETVRLREKDIIRQLTLALVGKYPPEFVREFAKVKSVEDLYKKLEVYKENARQNALAAAEAAKNERSQSGRADRQRGKSDGSDMVSRMASARQPLPATEARYRQLAEDIRAIRAEVVSTKDLYKERQETEHAYRVEEIDAELDRIEAENAKVLAKIKPLEFEAENMLVRGVDDATAQARMSLRDAIVSAEERGLTQNGGKALSNDEAGAEAYDAMRAEATVRLAFGDLSKLSTAELYAMRAEVEDSNRYYASHGNVAYAKSKRDPGGVHGGPREQRPWVSQATPAARALLMRDGNLITDLVNEQLTSRGYRFEVIPDGSGNLPLQAYEAKPDWLRDRYDTDLIDPDMLPDLADLDGIPIVPDVPSEPRKLGADLPGVHPIVAGLAEEVANRLTRPGSDPHPEEETIRDYARGRVIDRFPEPNPSTERKESAGLEYLESLGLADTSKLVVGEMDWRPEGSIPEDYYSAMRSPVATVATAIRKGASETAAFGRFVRSWFRKGGEFPEYAHRLDVAKNGKIASQMQKVSDSAKDYDRVIDRSTWTREEETLANRVAEVHPRDYATDPDVARFRARFGDEGVEATRAFRDEVDVLSALFRAEGVASGPILAAIDKNTGHYLIRQFDIFNNPKRHKRRLAEDPAIIDRFKSWLEADIRVNEGRTPTNDELNLEVARFLDPGEAKKGMAKILSKRKDLPDPLKALWGETKDPVERFAMTLARQRFVIEQSRFFRGLLEQGAGVHFFDKSQAAEYKRLYPDADWKELDLSYTREDGSKIEHPLNGKMTTPGMYDALKTDFNPKELPKYVRAYAVALGATKVVKTVLSHPTHVRNLVSNIGVAIRNGHTDPRLMAEAWRILRDDTPAGRELYRKLIEYGVIGDGVHYGELQQLVRDSGLKDGFSIADVAKWQAGMGRLATVAKKGYGAAKRLYLAEDAIWKVFGFLHETRAYSKAMPSWTKEQVERHAAAIVRDTYPTYSNVSKFVRGMRLNPAMGSFVSFPAEIIRTTYHTIRIGLTEIRSKNPEVRKIGYKRLVGLAVAMALAAGVSAATAMMFGVTADDESDIRRGLPEWSKNSRLLYTGRDRETGKVTYVDLSRIDPHAQYGEVLTAAFGPGDPATNSEAAARAAGRPYIEEEMLTRRVADVARNRTEDRGPVYNPQAPLADRAATVAGHLGGPFVPGSVTQLVRTGQAAAGTVDPRTGKSKDLLTEAKANVGIREATFDPREMVRYNAARYRQVENDTVQLMTRTLKARGPVTPQQLMQAQGEMEAARRRAFDEMREDVMAALRLGVPPATVAGELRAAGVAADEVQQLMSGRYRPKKIDGLDQSPDVRKRLQQLGPVR
jgi:hypothetical protein